MQRKTVSDKPEMPIDRQCGGKFRGIAFARFAGLLVWSSAGLAAVPLHAHLGIGCVDQCLNVAEAVSVPLEALGIIRVQWHVIRTV